MDQNIWKESRFFFVMLCAAVLAVLYAPGFFTVRNLILIANQISIVAAISSCIALVMAAGYFDLSIGSALAVTNMACALFLQERGGIILAVIGPLFLGLLLGGINGYFVGVKNLSSFSVTLATQIGFEGLAFIIGGGGFIFRATALQPLAHHQLLKLPVNVWILLVMALILQFLLDNTIYGRYLLAIGHKFSTAQAAGINVKKIVFINYSIVGVMTGVIGIIYTAKIGYGSLTVSTNYAYDGIVANLLGGNKISGGKSSILRAMFGAYIWGMLQNYMGYVGVPYYYQKIIKCIIILGAISRDKRIRQKAEQIWK